MNLDKNLIIKYDKPGPRYTSYPTAPHFHEGFTESDFLNEIRNTNQSDNNNPLSLYFHIPYCDTLCYFCGCNMIISRNRSRINEYIQYIKKEVEIIKGYLADNRKAVQLHWGGGTPTHLKPQEIRELSSFINDTFEFTDNSEKGCEIDPRELTKEHLQALKEGGFNRVSMGIQDFNPLVQKAVNRIHSEEMIYEITEWIRELQFDSMNLDLIYGLPHQTISSFGKTVEKIIKLNPDRIAVFNFAYVPWMKKHMELINEADLPKPEEKLEILINTINQLTDAGYTFIGMDHFAKPNDEMSVALKEKKLYRNFQGYSTHAGTDLYGFGITSISQFGRIYSQNVKREKEYYETLDKGVIPTSKGIILSNDDIIRRYVIMKIMCDFELNFENVENKFNIKFEDYFSSSLERIIEMTNDGLVEIKNRKLEVSETGRLLIRNIAMNFDGFIENKIDAGRYSRTV